MICHSCVIKANVLCVIITEENVIADIQVIRVDINIWISLLTTRSVGCFDRDVISEEDDVT